MCHIVMPILLNAGEEGERERRWVEGGGVRGVFLLTKWTKQMRGLGSSYTLFSFLIKQLVVKF